MKVIIRELQTRDAEISWKWRNDPTVWELTGRKWKGNVTKEIEENWIKEVKKNENEKRFAICVNEDEQYIGNVQLTNIEKGEAEFHIFIGEKAFWGHGIGSEATHQIIEYGFKILNLKRIYLFVKENNIPAIKAYQKCGFIIREKIENNLLMEIWNGKG